MWNFTPGSDHDVLSILVVANKNKYTKIKTTAGETLWNKYGHLKKRNPI